jgi:hypothetical protein
MTEAQEKKLAQRIAEYAGYMDLTPGMESMIWTLACVEVEEQQLQEYVDIHGTCYQVVGKSGDTYSRARPEWQQLKEDFPDWAEGVEAYVSSRTPSAAPQPAVDVDAIKTEVANEFEAKRREDALEVVAIFDADWQKKAGTPEFRQWIDAQSPEYRQRALNTWKASEILATVRAFDASRKPAAPAAPNPRLRGATIPNGTARVNLSKPVEEMTPQEYWAHLEAQDRKNQHAGR